jgi:hypothetical protein
MKERQLRLQAESDLEGYKEELRESYRVIVELRYEFFFCVTFLIVTNFLYCFCLRAC